MHLSMPSTCLQCEYYECWLLWQTVYSVPVSLLVENTAAIPIIWMGTRRLGSASTHMYKPKFFIFYYCIAFLNMCVFSKCACSFVFTYNCVWLCVYVVCFDVLCCFGVLSNNNNTVGWFMQSDMMRCLWWEHSMRCWCCVECAIIRLTSRIASFAHTATSVNGLCSTLGCVSLFSVYRALIGSQNAFSACAFSALTLLVGRQEEHRPIKIEWWGVGVVICLEQGADCLYMVQLMPLHPKTPPSLASFKYRLFLSFWYRLTQVVLIRGR